MIAEVVRWRRQASRYGLSLSEYVRTTMNRAKVRVVAVINGGFPIEAARVEAVLSSLHALYRRKIERG